MSAEPEPDAAAAALHTEEVPEAGLPPEAQVYRPPIAWENYLRCFFLTAVIFAVGFMAWRPGALRFSVLWSLANPSRGESLAWSPSDEKPEYLPPSRRAAPPDEWRLESRYSASWRGNRPRARQDGAAGGTLSSPSWRRYSANPWRWSDDSAALREKRKPPETQPPQKPATDFRAGNLAFWPETTGTGAAVSLTAPPLQGVPALGSPVSGSSLPALPAVSALPRLPGTPASSLPAGLPALPQAGNGSAPFLPPPASSAVSPLPAGPEGTAAGSVPPADQAAEDIDWKNREITGPVPGAYLTIYPKLKFVGLCVPEQGYIRKYNQVGIPRDTSLQKMEGHDGRTPYGRYYIASRRRDGDGARMYLSWPSPDDARRLGLDARAIAEIEHAWRRKELPPQDTAAGGGVGLNGLRNWVDVTDGGFTLEEPHMEEIYTALPDGAWVFIQP